MQAVYVSSNQFNVNEDKTSEFLAGRRVRALCGSEYKYSTVYSSVYSSPYTTIIIEENILISNLSAVHYGIVNIGEQGSFPNHSHDGTEGTGGALSLLTLSDTPDIYEEGEYLRSTTSGVEWTIPEAEATIIKVKEEDISAITKGQACTIVGSSGVKSEVGLCDCDDPNKIRIIGLAQTDISQNEDGIVVYKGVLTNVDTRTTNSGINPNGETWVSEDLLWVSNIPGGLTKNRPTSGRSIKAARTVKGNSATDTLIVISHENTTWSTAASGEDVVLRVGDSVGANKVSIRAYNNNGVAAFDSYGNLTVSGTVDGVDVATFKSDFDSHDHDDRYYTESEIDTISGSLQTDINTKSDTEWFLTDGVPSGSVGKKEDVAIDQEVGIIYERILDEIPIVTWNPSDKSVDVILSNGDLIATNSTAGWKGVRATESKSSGKYYCEFTVDSLSSSNGFRIGVGTIDETLGNVGGSYSYAYRGGGNKGHSNSWVAYGNTYATNDVISVALDLDNGKVWWAKNGVWQASGNPAAGTNEAYSGLSGAFFVMLSFWGAGDVTTINFGDTLFSYTIPTGFSSWAYEGVWEKKLTPDFLKLSDTPGSYDEGKYLKTTTSGIDFVEDLYTKSEVDTISGTLQTDIDGKADTVHIHDDRYYTESEVDTISGTLQTSIDSMPVTLLELADTPTTYSGSVGEYLKTTSSGVIFSDIDSEYWESVDVFLDENYSNDKGLPTQVERGLFKGYSMPIWATPANQYEELVFRIRVPFRWDGVTNPTFMILVSTSATEDVGDKFKFQMEWESKGVSNVIPDTTAETLTDEVTVTDGTAYYSYLASASLDATKLISGDNLQFRVRRVTATDPQVSNEIIIWHWDSRWKMNKLGTVSE